MEHMYVILHPSSKTIGATSSRLTRSRQEMFLRFQEV